MGESDLHQCANGCTGRQQWVRTEKGETNVTFPSTSLTISFHGRLSPTSLQAMETCKFILDPPNLIFPLNCPAKTLSHWKLRCAKNQWWVPWKYRGAVPISLYLARPAQCTRKPSSSTQPISHKMIPFCKVILTVPKPKSLLLLKQSGVFWTTAFATLGGGSGGGGRCGPWAKSGFHRGD